MTTDVDIACAVEFEQWCGVSIDFRDKSRAREAVLVNARQSQVESRT